MSAFVRPAPRFPLPGADHSMLVGAAATAAVLVLTAVAVYSPKDAVGAMIAAALGALAIWRLAIGLAVFVVMTFPEHLPGSLDAGATVAKPLGLILALAWIGMVVARRGSSQLLPRDHPALFWAVSGFIVLAGSSLLWAPDVAQARYQLGRLTQVAVLLLVVYTAASTRAAFRTIVWAFLVGSVITAGYSIASGSYGANGRLSGIFDPNYFAAELIPAILVSLFLLLTTSLGRTRAVAAVVLALDTVAFALTQSRGGIVGLAVALAAAVALAGRARPRVVVAVLVLLAVGLGYYLTYTPSHLRSSFSGSLSGASSGRSDEWRLALRMFANHPLNGVGLGNFIVVEPSYSTQSINLNFVRLVVTKPLVAHSSYLEAAAELGLLGVALFVAILSVPARRAGRALAALARAADPLEFYGRGLVAGAIGMFTAYVFLSGQYEKQLWLVLGLLASVPALARRSASDTPSAPTS